MRLCTSGLYDEYGKRYKPNLVRIGILDRNPPEIVRQHSIEYLTQQEINKMKDFDKDAVRCNLISLTYLPILERENNTSNRRRAGASESTDREAQETT